MSEWFAEYDHILKVLGIVSVVVFIGSMVIVPWILISLPQDFFTRKSCPAAPKNVFWMSLRLLKNLLGVLLMLAGILMLFLPGQGILAILLGIALLNFPGKNRLQARIICHPRVCRLIQWLRRKARKEAFEIPERPKPSKRILGTKL